MAIGGFPPSSSRKTSLDGNTDGRSSPSIKSVKLSDELIQTIQTQQALPTVAKELKDALRHSRQSRQIFATMRGDKFRVLANSDRQNTWLRLRAPIPTPPQPIPKPKK